MKVFLLVVLIVALIVFVPFLTIWAVSTLWQFDAVYDFWNWLAALCVGSGLFAGGKSKN